MSACSGEGDEPVVIHRDDDVEVGVEANMEVFACERQDQTLEVVRSFEEAESRKLCAPPAPVRAELGLVAFSLVRASTQSPAWA